MFARYSSKSADLAFVRRGALFPRAISDFAPTDVRVAMTPSRRADAGRQSKPI
jgi:hypothetical protein